MVPAPENLPASRRRWRPAIPHWLRSSAVVLVLIIVVEYFVVPELVGASRNIDVLRRLSVGWLVTAVALEAASLMCYAMLTRTLLPGVRPPISRLFRLVLATTAISHVIPGGGAGGVGVGYQLLTAEGVEGPDAAFTLAAQAVGSAIGLNLMLWIALVISIPLAGLHPLYVVIALIGVVAMLAAAALYYAISSGTEGALHLVRAVGARIPGVGGDRLEHVVRRLRSSVRHLARNRGELRTAALWIAMNWVLDAASLWSFLAALGRYVNPFELFAAYGIANVLAAIPLTPGGLGVVEASAATLIVSFGVPRTIGTLAVLGWRLVNFWLPIPVGGVAYLSLRWRGKPAPPQTSRTDAAD